MKRTFTFILIFLFTLPAFSASVWKVSNGNHTLYVGGTLHLLSPSDFPLPQVYYDAYEDADTLVFETDIDAINSPAFAQQSMQLLTYQDGSILTNHISQETYTALETHLAARGVDIQNLLPFKPAMFSITLSMIELKMMGLTSEGVDKHMFDKGKTEGKQLKWLETPEQQLNFILKMGVGSPDDFLTYTLEDLKTLPEALPLLKQYWFEGDMQAMYRNSMMDFKQNYPDIFNDLLTSRNDNWLPKLNAFMATPETEFVLVGAMHLPGEDGVLNLLQKEGYKVEKLQ